MSEFNPFNRSFSEAFNSFQNYLEQIITGNIPLRDPSISVVHITPENIEKAHRKILQLFNQFKDKYSQWNFKVVNIEAILFEILKKLRYLKKPFFAKDCRRSELSNDMQNSIKKDLILKVEMEIKKLKESQQKSSKNPSILLIMNFHAAYPYIQTKDLIARIINEKGILILILYLQVDKKTSFEKESYKSANYNVHTIYLN